MCVCVCVCVCPSQLPVSCFPWVQLILLSTRASCFVASVNIKLLKNCEIEFTEFNIWFISLLWQQSWNDQFFILSLFWRSLINCDDWMKRVSVPAVCRQSLEEDLAPSTTPRLSPPCLSSDLHAAASWTPAASLSNNYWHVGHSGQRVF